MEEKVQNRLNNALEDMENYHEIGRIMDFIKCEYGANRISKQTANQLLADLGTIQNKITTWL